MGSALIENRDGRVFMRLESDDGPLVSASYLVEADMADGIAGALTVAARAARRQKKPATRLHAVGRRIESVFPPLFLASNVVFTVIVFSTERGSVIHRLVDSALCAVWMCGLVFVMGDKMRSRV